MERPDNIGRPTCEVNHANQVSLVVGHFFVLIGVILPALVTEGSTGGGSMQSGWDSGGHGNSHPFLNTSTTSYLT